MKDAQLREFHVLEVRSLKGKVDPVIFAQSRYGIEINDKGRGRCPFPENHNNGDANPSLRFYNGRFSCKSQGCLENADVFDLVKKIDRVGFMAAKQIVAEYAGEWVRGSGATRSHASAREAVHESTMHSSSHSEVTAAGPRQVVASYDYHDRVGDVVYTIDRWEGGGGQEKDFRARPSGVKRKDRVLYRLPELIKSDGPVIIVEGEKCADVLIRLGYTATTCAFGSDAWLPHYAETLRDRHVIMWPDNDVPGEKFGQAVLQSLNGVAASLSRVQPPDYLPEAGDVADVLGQRDEGEVRRLLEAAAPWQAQQPGTDAANAAVEPDSEVEEPVAVPVEDEGDVASSDDRPEEATDDWPEPPEEAAYYGLAGDIVRAIEPHTESDPAALLLQTMVGFGSVVGDKAHYEVEAKPHPSRENTVLVGKTSKGRKGTSWNQVLNVLGRVDEEWAKDRRASGLSSGEGLIWAVRDPIEKQEPIRENGKKSGKVTGYQTVVTDEGIADKRLMVIEEEFASVLRMPGREGNILSAVIRQAWDDGNLRTLVKNSPARATGAHISIIGHITRDELLRHLDSTEQANGFANRFLWAAVRRSKALPEGGNIEDVDLRPLLKQLKKAVEAAGTRSQLKFDDDARAVWWDVYESLSEGKPGLLGAITARAEAHVCRLALTYALLDCEDAIRTEHLLAALALWEYCERSAVWIFGEKTGDPIADRILWELTLVPAGLTRTEIGNLFSRHGKRERISSALDLLKSNRKAELVLVKETGGRNAERWCISARKAI